MIPKIIHYTWFSGDKFPDKIQRCIDSWHKYMPDYQYFCWDAERIKEIDSVWVKEAIEEKKWAFAADYVRLYAVSKYGGIYLDTDCFVYQSFDCFLNDKSFIGKESSMHIEGCLIEMHLTSHCFGAEPHDYFVEHCLSFYRNRHYKDLNDTMPFSLRHGIVMLPYIQSEIAKQHGYCPYPSANRIQILDCGVKVYPPQFFDVTNITKDSYCKHLAVGAWRESRLSQQKVTIAYKIRWRLEYALRYVMGKLGYILIKKI